MRRARPDEAAAAPAFAQDEARRRGRPELQLYTNAAMAGNLVFYPRLGFTEVDRRSEHGFERVFFVKRLAG
jgi:hypothetical protein